MKRLKQNRRASSLAVAAMLVVVVALASPARSQDEEPAQPSEPELGPEQRIGEAAAESKPAEDKPAEDQPEDQPAGMWTCSMHPQVHQAESGNCPICGMHLVSQQHENAHALMSLDRMLSLALQHNPDVRAARANIIAAEAELDRTRLAVVQKIIAYRERWNHEQAFVFAAARELEAAQQAANRDGLADETRQQATILVSEARKSLAFRQARLREIEAETPFLLGRRNVEQADAGADSNAAIIQERLIPMIEQLIKMTIEDCRSGKAPMTDMLPWSRRLAELKVRIATTNGERIAAIQSYLGLLKSTITMAEQRYREGETQQRDVLAAMIQLSEGELWLTDVRGRSQ